MTTLFLRDNPLQAAKLVAILGVVLFAVSGFLRLLPPIGDFPLLDWQFLALVLTPLVSLGLVLIITVETGVALYRAVTAESSLTTQLKTRPGYTVIRFVEASIALLGTIALVFALVALTGATLPAPAGVGLMLIGFGVALLVFGASLVRTLAEYYYHRQSRSD